MFLEPPKLSDETAYELIEFLNDFIVALENHYSDQLRRYYKILYEMPEPELAVENEFIDDDVPF